MATKLEIYNKALIKLGCETIENISLNTKPVRLINNIYDGLKREELQKNNWFFAKKKADLYSKAIIDSANNLALVSVAGVVLSVNANIVTVTAADVGTAGNDIVLKSSNDKVIVSSVTLTGGSATVKASGSITFNANLTAQDVITIGATQIAPCTDFVLGQNEKGQFADKFELPSDCLLLLELEGYGPVSTYPYQFGTHKDYDLIANAILTNNKNQLTIFYTAQTDESAFDANFVNVLACRIATELCEVLTQSDNKDKKMLEKYFLAVKEAKRINAIQLPNMSASSGILERSRL